MRVFGKPQVPSFLPSSIVPSLNQSLGILNVRGGTADAATDLVVDMSRVGLRLAGMSSYALVASLLLGAAISLFSLTPIKLEKHHTKLEATAMWIYSVLVAINIASSLHTAITMNMLNMYANTALGKGLDARFLEFWNDPSTHALRESAFQSFIMAIQTFKGCFALTVFLRNGYDATTTTTTATTAVKLYNQSKRWVATIAAVIFMTWGSLQHRIMLQLASDTIFRTTGTVI